MDTNKVSFEPRRILGQRNAKSNKCICPKCGHETSKSIDVLCSSIKCPVCRSFLVNK